MEYGTEARRLHIETVPRALFQLPYTVWLANLARLPIWRSSIFKSRQIYRTTASYSDLSSISVKYGASILNMKLQPNGPLAIPHIYLSGGPPLVVTRVNKDGSSFSFCIFACHSASFCAASFFSRIVLHLM